MFIDLDSYSTPMTVVYELRVEHKNDPQRVARTQALTMNPDKPLMGLRGKHGLYGTPDWWESIAAGRIEKRVLVGTITKTYFAGQDARWGDEVNECEVAFPSGAASVEIPDRIPKREKRRFTPGAVVCVVYAFDELKKPAADGNPAYSRVLLEMAVSS